MSLVKLNKKKGVFAALFTAILIGGAALSGYAANYIPTGRDTKLPPEKVSYDIVNLDRYELLYETEDIAYYFREDRDVIAVYDKRNEYVWKTGADLAFSSDINDAIDAAKTEEELLAAAEPKEKSLNTTYTGIANSLITVEYYESDTVKYISSASKENATSTLYTLNNNPATRCLDVAFDKLDLQIKVYITFTEDSITYDIPYEEISGQGKYQMASIWVTPFLGASGGMAQYYDVETGEYGDAVSKYMVPGYVLVPDGCGGLIRFADNEAAFTEYIGDVYGSDLSTEPYYYSYLSDVVPLKNPVLPVFGVAHGDRQAAFVAYAQSGAEYMDIIVRPEENKKVLYTWAYPRFEYNTSYFQVYNKQGAGFFSRMEEPQHVDISMTYTFLAGDGTDGRSHAADYTGMAVTYREHLIEQGVLSVREQTSGTMPIRIDFMMADSKSGLLGTEQVVVTDTDGVDKILAQLLDDGVTNINSGLIGWQKNGETLTRPDKAKYSGSIGTKKDFTGLIEKYQELGVDISYARETSTINKKMTNYFGTAAKHVNTWYIYLSKEWILPENAPVLQFSYATAEKVAEWTEKLVEKTGKAGDSFTFSGISNVLTGTYDRSGVATSVTDAISIYQDTMAKLHEDVKLNLVNPNMYLWQYTDRYLQMPVGTSQYVFETDTVPFLQMVLYGTMEMYAPYSNFSFYTQSDILKMIDYNMSPSFILSEEPSYLLADTASADLYSTEFAQYEEMIVSIYGKVNEILSQTKGYSWTDRTVLENGVICNTYEKDGDTFCIIINYTENSYNYSGTSVDGLTAKIIR
ncbi:MAG: hypothetical protein E7260_05195 [Lachnospiraceae bacterium]|nr:hypothetical protein [Lachnospiraceae bacterium]